MRYAYLFASIGVRGLNVKAATAVAGAAFEFGLYFKCIKLGGVTMPGFGISYLVWFVWVAGILVGLGG